MIRGERAIRRACEDDSTNLIDIALVQFVVAYEESHIDAAIKQVKNQIQIELLRKLATIDTALLTSDRLLAGAASKNGREILPSSPDLIGRRR